ncbi:MAG: DNA-deoxyinosine glycosylase [Christensenellaceae bacterium]|jgi:hypoxanthine-DNA glycosylase|nr:DNA-deoxyinosine glycosylase [Christensenellaceae bacterium]
MGAQPLRQVHTIPPLYDAGSRVLILGSFPSVRSREQGFFYGHPQNRFWKVLSAVCAQPLPDTLPEKRQLLLGQHIALWDVIASCTIVGSSDASLRDIIANDIAALLCAAPIEQIYTNGAAARALYARHCQPHTHREALRLPSTSPANAAWDLEKLIAAWSVIV